MIETIVSLSGMISYNGVTNRDNFDLSMFNKVMGDFSNMDRYSCDGDKQAAIHSNLGSITVLDRMTGFGYRDTETGYRDTKGEFWLASGDYDVRLSGAKTFGDAIKWIKERANTCVGVDSNE